MESSHNDLDRLSNIYSQLDTLNTQDKQKVIDYLQTSISSESNVSETLKETSWELLDTVKESNNNNALAQESREHKEKISSQDILVYIHWNPRWHQSFWEIESRQKDPLLAQGIFDVYYSPFFTNGKRIFARKLNNSMIEYTMTRPSHEVEDRPWWYAWLSFVLKNGYKVKETWELPSQNIQLFDPSSKVGDLMTSFMEYIIDDLWLFTENKVTHTLQRKTTNKDEIRKKLLRLKSTFISSMNENDANDYITRDT